MSLILCSYRVSIFKWHLSLTNSNPQSFLLTLLKYASDTIDDVWILQQLLEHAFILELDLSSPVKDLLHFRHLLFQLLILKTMLLYRALKHLSLALHFQKELISCFFLLVKLLILLLHLIDLFRFILQLLLKFSDRTSLLCVH